MTLDYYAYLFSKEEDTALEQENPHLAYFIKEALHNESNGSEKRRVRDSWQKRLHIANAPWQNPPFDFGPIPDSFAFIPDTSAIEWLPRFSFILQLPFKLDKPYLSKDEKSFYILENPLRREKVFKTPMMAASGWKGNLRAVMVQLLVQWWTELDTSEREKRSNRKEFVLWRLSLVRLFGTERGTNIDGKDYNHYLDKVGGDYQGRWFRRCLKHFTWCSGFMAGRLQFYPTFFKKIALEIINPHDRKTGTSAHGPILLECVPEGTEGLFSMIYVPFDSWDRNGETFPKTVEQDLILLAEGIRAMLTVYGFGARTSSGFGIVEEKLAGKGRLLIKAEMSSQEPDFDLVAQQAELPRYLETYDRLIEELRCPNGTLKEEEEYRQWLENHGLKYSKNRKQLYHKAKAWWKQRQLAEKESTEITPENPLIPEKTFTIKEITFDTLNGFCSQARGITATLREGGVV